MKRMKRFYIATDKEIKSGETTDIYFRRTREILIKKNIKKNVVAEVTCSSLPRNWKWGVLCGIEEVANLFQNCRVDIDAIPEGEIFTARDKNGIRIPIMNIKGPYLEFCELETPMLGLICQTSGVATSSARIRKILGEKLILSFGVRRMHPGVCVALDRAAYIGGFDGVSCVLSARRLGIKPVGTMPHALIIIFGNQVDAWKAFDEVIDEEVPRIALCDTYYDEKIEVVMASEAIRNLSAVRLDTPGSRRGNFSEIIREVRWELDIRGYKDVKIFISGGLDEENLRELVNAPVDGFGVGTSVSNAPTIDFAMNIVEIDKKPVAKRGVLGGEKQVYRCPECFEFIVKLSTDDGVICDNCNVEMEPLLKPLIRNGKIVAKLQSAQEIRKKVLKELSKVEV